MIICTPVTAVNVITQNTRLVNPPMIIEFMGGVFLQSETTRLVLKVL